MFILHRYIKEEVKGVKNYLNLTVKHTSPKPHTHPHTHLHTHTLLTSCIKCENERVVISFDGELLCFCGQTPPTLSGNSAEKEQGKFLQRSPNKTAATCYKVSFQSFIKLAAKVNS